LPVCENCSGVGITPAFPATAERPVEAGEDEENRPAAPREIVHGLGEITLCLEDAQEVAQPLPVELAGG